MATMKFRMDEKAIKTKQEEEEMKRGKKNLEMETPFAGKKELVFRVARHRKGDDPEAVPAEISTLSPVVLLQSVANAQHS